MTRGEALQECQEGEEDVVSELVRLVAELKYQHEGFSTQDYSPVLQESFTVALKQQGPHGYLRSLLVLEAQDEALSLSVFGEEKFSEASERHSSSGSITDDSCGIGRRQARRRLSLRETRRPKDATLPTGQKVGRSRSLNNIKGRASPENINQVARTDRSQSQKPKVSVQATQPVPQSEVKRAPSLEALKAKRRVSNAANVYEPEEPICESRVETDSQSISDAKKPRPPSDEVDVDVRVVPASLPSPDTCSHTTPECRADSEETEVTTRRQRRDARGHRGHRHQRRQRVPAKLKCSVM